MDNETQAGKLRSRRERKAVLALARAAANNGDVALARALFALVGISYVPAVHS
jgi:hypothetical protein